jgi:hypothetical protein
VLLMLPPLDLVFRRPRASMEEWEWALSSLASRSRWHHAAVWTVVEMPPLLVDVQTGLGLDDEAPSRTTRLTYDLPATQAGNPDKDEVVAHAAAP